MDKSVAKSMDLIYTRAMTRIIIVAALACAVISAPVFAASGAPQTDVERLEQVLERADSGRRQGRLKQDRYDEFLVQFRAALDQAWSVSRHEPLETAAYARIENRLGDPVRAREALDAALKQNPQSVPVRLAAGEIELQKKNYAAALSHADAILKVDPANVRAQALKHFSEGRASGSSASIANPQAPAPPSLTDAPTSEETRRASARQNAVHFSKEASARLNINDPGEALRYATLAEVSDPTYPDAPMEQGLAFMGLKTPSKAVERFARAEELWQAAGDKNQELAKSMKERAAAQVQAEIRGAPPPPGSAPDSRRTTWPLGGATAGAGVAAAAFALRRKKEESASWERPAMIVGVICLCAVGAGIVGYGLFLMSASTTLEVGSGAVFATESGSAALEGYSAARTATVAVRVAQGMSDAEIEAAALNTAAATAAAGAMASARATQDLAPNLTIDRTSTGEDAGAAPKAVPYAGDQAIANEDESNPCKLKPGEDILDRFIDGTRLAPGFLYKHEGRAIGLGHTIEEHINKDLNDLQIKLRKSALSEYPSDYASTFFNIGIAEQIIRSVVIGQKMQVMNWYMVSPKISERFNYKGNRSIPIGEGISVGDISLLVKKFDARIVLKRMPACRILILTSFPE